MTVPRSNAVSNLAIVSDCCGAATRVGGDDPEGTRYAVCTGCGEPCTTVPVRSGDGASA